MKNMQKGFSTSVVLIAILIILGSGYYLYSKNVSPEKDEVLNRSTIQFKVYRNSDIGYQYEIPASWKIYGQGGTFVFPEVNSGASLDDLYRINKVGISVITATPSTKEKLNENFSKIYRDFELTSFPQTSPDILEIRSMELPSSSDASEPDYGYSGIAYAIKTAKRIYTINVFYKDSEGETEQKENISKIIETLKED